MSEPEIPFEALYPPEKYDLFLSELWDALFLEDKKQVAYIVGLFGRRCSIHTWNYCHKDGGQR